MNNEKTMNYNSMTINWTGGWNADLRRLLRGWLRFNVASARSGNTKGGQRGMLTIAGRRGHPNHTVTNRNAGNR